MGKVMAWGGGSKLRKQYVQRPSALLWGQMSSGRSTVLRTQWKFLKRGV